ncbi:MAG: transposase [Burkholderiales bacterium]|nr:transposase [Burkholderiales bacterium]
MNISAIGSAEHALPLCRSYECVSFDAIAIPLDAAAGVRSVEMLWAVGILSDRLPHFLGCWPRAGAADVLWRSVAFDLHHRGVERIRFLLGPDSAEMTAAMACHFRSVTVLSASATAVDQALVDSVSPERRCIERAQEVAEQLTPYLKRAVARHGGFASPAAAAALLRERAERYVDANWPEPPELPPPLRSPRATACSALTAARS